jgi:hypothetical protein
MNVPGEDDDLRLRSAWRTWLSALAVDGEAAMAASLAYESLAPEGRDAWLDALVEDSDEVMRLGVPAVALYAPLLAVEPDPARRLRIGAVLASKGQALAHKPVRALCGRTRTGEHLALLLSPLYLDFVAVLVCRYRPDRGFISARREPVRHVLDVIGCRMDDPDGKELSCTVDGVEVVEMPLSEVIEDLAHAIVADRRDGRAAPFALGAYVDLFAPDIGPSSRSPSSVPAPPSPRAGNA